MDFEFTSNNVFIFLVKFRAGTSMYFLQTSSFQTSFGLKNRLTRIVNKNTSIQICMFVQIFS